MSEVHTAPVDYEAQAKGLIQKTLALESQLKASAEEWKAMREKLECDLVSAQSESNRLRSRLAAANAEVGRLQKRESKHREETNRHKSVGAALMLLFLAASFVMTFLAAGGIIPMWQVPIPIIAALGVGSVTGWSE